MRREWVVLTPMQRQFACDALAAALHEQEVEIIAFCVGAKHWHGLLRFRDPEKHCGQDRDARVLIGFAKGKTARAMSRAVIIEPGGVWGKKCRVRPVRNRAHHLNIVKYILVHEKKGAAISYLPKSAKPGASAPGPCTP